MLVRDITDSEKNRRALIYERTVGFNTLSNIEDGVITCNGKAEVIYINPVTEFLLHLSSNTVEGQPIQDVFKLRHSPKEYHPVLQALQESIRIGPINSAICYTGQGKEIYIDYSVIPFQESITDEPGAVVIIRDAREKHEEKQTLSYQASHDPLTGLLNRRSFEDQLNAQIKTLESTHEHAFLFIDLDQFKIVNDTSGHTAGDHILKMIAVVIANHVRREDLVARLGGDEFGVLLLDCGFERAQEIANNIIDGIKRSRYEWQNKRFNVGASIGLVKLDETVTSPHDIFAAADAACYGAKEKGRNCLVAHTIDDSEVKERRREMEWVSRIQTALDEDHFELYVQPIQKTNTQSGEKSHFVEVLLRLKTQDGQLEMPKTFIPAAERYGLMPAIDQWVVKRVLQSNALKNICEQNPDIIFAINLSAHTLAQENFLNSILTDIDSSAIPAEHIVFELAETGAMNHLHLVQDFIHALRSRGARFTLDDFGTGVSSFNYLKAINIDFLKIDGSFIEDMANDEVSAAMVDSINRIAHLMNIDTIAEYVESIEVKGMLRAMGVNMIQGNAIAKPIQLEHWLKEFVIH